MNELNRKVIHIVHWERSGIFSVANELAAQGLENGHSHAVRVIRKQKGYWDIFLSLFRMASIFFEIIFKQKNLYHAHSFLPFMFLYLITGKGAVTFHNLYPFFSSASKKDKIKRDLIRKLFATKSISSSSVGKAVADAVQRHLGITSVVIFNGLMVERYHFSVPGKKTILGAAGRLDDQKNFEALVVAFSRCKCDGVQLHIAGEGVKRSVLELLIKQHGLENNVFLLGHQGDMPAFYASIDAFICSSLYEGFGIVLAEAILSGKPVISTNVGIAVDLEAISIIRSGFEIDDLASAIDQWQKMSLSEIELSANHNRAAIIDEFTISKIYQQYVEHVWSGV